MNKKTVLFLINGFGVEKKQSYSIYDASLMPTFDSLTKKYLFSTITSNVNNYYDGYRNASLDVNELFNYSILDKEIENKKLTTNPNLINLKQTFDNKKGNLHIFVLVDTSLKIVDHLKETLKFLNPNKDKKIYLHLIMTSPNIADYNPLSEVFSKINMELSPLATIGFVMGLSAISNNAKEVDLNFFFKMFITKVGEKWLSFDQKFSVLQGTKVLPRDCKPFIVNSNFDLTINDTFFIYNYDNINLTNFLTTLGNIKFGENNHNFSYYSLFAVTCNLQIPYMYNNIPANVSLVKNLEFIDATSLILCSKEKVGIINYFCNGLKNEASKTITFIDIDPIEYDTNQIINVINSSNNDLIIIDYDLENCQDVASLKNKLQAIDKVLKTVYENMEGSKYSLIISSLYGISKIMLNEKNNICQVIFSGKVPFVFIDDFITKRNYLITTGSINGIFKSCFKNIKSESKYESLVEKQNGLYKLFFK